MADFSRRADVVELMDDPSRPDAEFDHAYRELKTINERLGGVRAVERFLPKGSDLSVLDVASGGCDIGEALLSKDGRVRRVVSVDINSRGLRRARQSHPVIADGLQLPFPNSSFDAVVCSLTFHHLSNNECVSVLREMWRVASATIIVNDLHRHPVAHASIRLLSRLFSTSVMVRHDGPVSVLRAFIPGELEELGRKAGLPCRVYRSFPYRIVLVANK
jgi:ubiquinone/menaquinone biosynthesis C-methylase UbiE